MDFTSHLIDELIEMRRQSRLSRDWKSSDELRDYLDTQLVFVFDGKDGQEVYNLPEQFFKFKTKTENATKVKSFLEWLRDTARFTMTNRQYVELQIKSEINADKNFDAWLFSTKTSAGVTRK
jgi:hypothetical protein